MGASGRGSRVTSKKVRARRAQGSGTRDQEDWQGLGLGGVDTRKAVAGAVGEREEGHWTRASSALWLEHSSLRILISSLGPQGPSYLPNDRRGLKVALGR